MTPPPMPPPIPPPAAMPAKDRTELWGWLGIVITGNYPGINRD